MGFAPLLDVLLLLLVLGCIGKQKAALILLRLLGVMGLTSCLTAPLVLPQIAATATSPEIDLLMSLPAVWGYILAALGSVLSIATLWITFGAKVSSFFKAPMRFNILG